MHGWVFYVISFHQLIKYPVHAKNSSNLAACMTVIHLI